MASQVLSGSSNPSYTNNTGQNVRILINYIASCTSMTWAGVTVTGNSTVGKDVMTINGEVRQITGGTNQQSLGTLNLPLFVDSEPATGYLEVGGGGTADLLVSDGYPVRAPFLSSYGNTLSPNIHYIPLTITPGGDFPSELILAAGEAFSAVSGAFNIVAIKEDGT